MFMWILQLNAEAVDHPEPFSAVFSMAKMQLEALLEPSNSNTLAVKLGIYILHNRQHV